MTFPWRWLLNLFFLVTCTLALTAAQTSLWQLVVGSFPPPMFWLMILVYIALTRNLAQATFLYYLLTLVISSFTSLPMEHFLVLNTLMLLLIVVIRGRIFWPGSTYYMLVCGSLSLIVPMFHWILSRLWDKNPMFAPELFSWVISGLMTMLISVIVYRVLQWFDQVILSEGRSEGLGAQYE